MKLYFSIFLTVCLVLGACKKKGFKSISETDELGNAIDHPDPTDWGEDKGNWSNKIDQLMGEDCELSAYGNTCEVIMNPTYPNPFSTWTQAYFNTTDSCLVNIVLVDKKNNVYLRACHQLTGGDGIFGIDAAALELSANTYYRLYYEFSNSDGISFYKGHGDIKTL